MEQATGSSLSDAEAVDQVDRQHMIEYYVDEIIGRLVERPFDSAPQLFQYATMGGPRLSQEGKLHLFGGRIIFLRARRRVNAIRRSVLYDAMDTIPRHLRTWAVRERPSMDPPFRDRRSSRSPHLDSPALWWYEEPDTGEEITRYPAVLDTEVYFHESDNNNWPDESDVDMDAEDSEWFQFTDCVNGERCYD